MGRELLLYGFISHVVNEHDFKDEALFYVFSVDVSRSLVSKTEAIVSRALLGCALVQLSHPSCAESFAKLSAHADLGRFTLSVHTRAMTADAVSARVADFLFRVCSDVGCDELAEQLRSFCVAVQSDHLPEALRGRLLSLEEASPTDASARFVSAILKCCTQSSAAAYIVFLKQRSHSLGGVRSGANSWTINVSATPDLVFVTQTREETNTPGAPVGVFSFRWHVLFVLSRHTNTLVQVVPMLTSFSGPKEVHVAIERLFEKMRIITS